MKQIREEKRKNRKFEEEKINETKENGKKENKWRRQARSPLVGRDPTSKQ